MKIAFLNIYNGIVERGSEVFVKEMAERLATTHNVHVFQTGISKNEKYKVYQIKNIPFIPYHRLYHFAVLFFTLKCLLYLWRENYDWIIPINGRAQVILMRLLRFLRGGKILISGHAGIGFEDKFNLIFGCPTIFVALTPTAYLWAKNYYPKVKIVYIPNGVDVKRFNPDITESKLKLPKPIILCVCALLPYKRIDLLIKAVSRLHDVSLLIIGDGPLKEKIVNLGEDLLKDRFLLVPFVSNSRMAHYYSSARVFSLPSRENEAFGLVYLEAMACNKPVVAPDDKNRREIINGAGVFCNPANIEEYSRSLLNALSTDFEKKPRIQAEKFSWDVIAKRYEEILSNF